MFYRFKCQLLNATKPGQVFSLLQKQVLQMPRSVFPHSQLLQTFHPTNYQRRVDNHNGQISVIYKDKAHDDFQINVVVSFTRARSYLGLLCHTFTLLFSPLYLSDLGM